MKTKNILERLRRLGSASQLISEEIAALQKELEPTQAPVPVSRQRLKVVRKAKYAVLIRKPRKAS